MTRRLWYWVWALLHEPTASLSPACHSETYQKRIWQRGLYYCKFNSGEIKTKLLALGLPEHYKVYTSSPWYLALISSCLARRKLTFRLLTKNKLFFVAVMSIHSRLSLKRFKLSPEMAMLHKRPHEKKCIYGASACPLERCGLSFLLMAWSTWHEIVWAESHVKGKTRVQCRHQYKIR